MPSSGLEVEPSADVRDVRVGEGADELPERVGRPGAVRVGEGDDVALRLADGAVLRGHLAAARIADHAGAGGLGELLRPVGGRVGGDDDLDPVGRVVELAEIRHAPLDHRLLVVGGDDHGDRRQGVLVGEHRPRAHTRERPRRERVRGVRPHERARRSPEEDLCDRHRRSASLRPPPLFTASLSHAEPGLLRRGRAPELHEGGSGAARAARARPGNRPAARPYGAALRRRHVRRVPPPARPADAGRLPRRRLGNARRADRPRPRRSGTGAARARACARRRARRRQLHAGRRARRGEARDSRSRISRPGCAASTRRCPRSTTGGSRTT